MYIPVMQCSETGIQEESPISHSELLRNDSELNGLRVSLPILPAARILYKFACRFIKDRSICLSINMQHSQLNKKMTRYSRICGHI